MENKEDNSQMRIKAIGMHKGGTESTVIHTDNLVNGIHSASTIPPSGTRSLNLL